MNHLLLLIHAAATLFMVGLIWTIQIVHYPLFEHVGIDNSTAYQAGHQWRITLVVLPVMLVELISAGTLWLYRPPHVPAWAILSSVVLVGLIWLSTLLVQSPIHGRLNSGFNRDAWALLVNTNWFRTIAWSLRGGLAFWMLSLTLKG